MNTVFSGTMLFLVFGSALPAAVFVDGLPSTTSTDPLQPGVYLNFTTTGAVNDLATVSSPSHSVPGRDVFGRFFLQPGGTADLAVSPTTSWDPALYLFSSPSGAAGSLLSYADVQGAGAAESLSFTNTTGSDMPIYVGVDSELTNSNGGFNFSVAGSGFTIPEPASAGLFILSALVLSVGRCGRRETGQKEQQLTLLKADLSTVRSPATGNG